ncbi:hypothetical protein EDB85DRAFT_2159718 [Lactarius pseudohatsudake]|nr:hypothetical protein EDB85DRAFT_2159718 [Lactarius pseudohatsudake]
MPAAPRPPGPSLLPVRATTFARKEGARGHAAAAASPVRGTPFARKGGARGLAPCPSSSYLAAPVRAGKGARDPPALPFPSRGRGAYGSTPPHHPVSAPALPSCPRNPVRADRGRARPDRPTSPRRPRPRPVPLVRATPFARSEGVRGQEHAERGHARARDPSPLLPHSRGRGAREGTLPLPLRVAPALFPFPLRATPFARKGGARHRPALRVAPAPFPSLFAPRARASRPDLWRPVRAGRGARGQADPASLRVAQRGWTVSVRPRSPRPHRIFQVTIRTAPEATPPHRGRDDGLLRQAPSLVPSCSPSPHCCGMCDDDDAAASDPNRDGPDPAMYYPAELIVFLNFDLLDLIQFVHVEDYFNDLNEFDQVFAHNDQLVYLIYSLLAFHPDYPSFNI